VLVVLSASILIAVPATATPPGASGVRVHEWGVWKIQEGRIAHLADLERESPEFVRRAVRGGSAEGGAVSRKPVVYVYADAPVDLSVRVGFTGGGPWLFFPGTEMERGRFGRPCAATLSPVVRDRAMAAPCEAVDHLRWRVRADPMRAGGLPDAPRGHFWHDLRAVPSTVLEAPDGSREKFLFYDGPVAFHEPYRVRREDDAVRFERTGTGGASELVLANGSRWVGVTGLDRGLAARMRTGRDWPAPTHPLTSEIGRRLRVAGLSVEETRALVETWRPEIEAPGLKAFWLLPRAEYDALLPIEITPAPSEIVRVGLVIERI
jgi:hypothetical protein